MVITQEPVGVQRSFKIEKHSLSKSLGVFEVQKSDSSISKGSCPVRLVKKQ